MKLYYSPGACSLSPHRPQRKWPPPSEKVKADTKAKIMRRRRRPASREPAWLRAACSELDDGTRLTEGPAIVQYIADQVPGKSWRHADTAPWSAPGCSHG